MIVKKTHIDVIYTKFNDNKPVIRERIQTMGIFYFNTDLSVEIATKNPGSDIQVVTWDHNDRSGMVRYKNKDTSDFIGGTIKAYNDDTIIKLNISENETLECKVDQDIDLSKFFDKEVKIEYWRESENNSTVVDTFAGYCNTVNGSVKIDCIDSEIKSIRWVDKSGSIVYSDGSTREFEGGTVNADGAVFADDSNLIMARYL